MSNDMEDLRREVQRRLYETLHGKEIDMMEGVTPHIPHMLGITSLNAIHTHHSEEGTLLDPSSDFWENYEEDIETKSAAARKIQTAIRSLKDDGLFEMTWPYGKEADIAYCEVEPVDNQDTDILIESPCPECGEILDPEPSLNITTGSGHLKLSVKCDECQFTATYGTAIYRL